MGALQAEIFIQPPKGGVSQAGRGMGIINIRKVCARSNTINYD